LSLGEPAAKYAEVFAIVRAAQAAGVAAAVPGATIHDVDQACRDTITDAGNRLVLEPGMVITVEPGIYLAGEFGVRIEDTIAITAGAADRLSASARELVVAGGPAR